MAQFDVYLNTNPRTYITVPYLLDVQSDLLETLTTRVVVPLMNIGYFGQPAKRLNPVFEIEQLEVVMSTTELAGVRANILGRKATSLSDQRDSIIAALDLLLTGI